MKNFNFEDEWPWKPGILKLINREKPGISLSDGHPAVNDKTIIGQLLLDIFEQINLSIFCQKITYD